MATPTVSIAKPIRNNRTNGVLPVSASGAQGMSMTSSTGVSTIGASKAVTPRLKVIIRRLPPGLTEDEFNSTLGEEWRVENKLVDWTAYKPGKISADPAKPSKPSRVYLHLVNSEVLGKLSDKVRDTLFIDAKASMSDTALLGPPVVEFAPYGKVPSGKPRKDARQGTIDQDPEFIDFLESLTNPIAKPALPESNSELDSKKGDKATVTPLIQYLRDKKASKSKDSTAATKAAKHSRQESKETKTAAGTDKKAAAKAAAKAGKEATTPKSAQAIKVEKAARDAVRVLNKQPSENQIESATSSSPSSKAAVSSPQKPLPTPLVAKQRERGNASAAARILQRDLGIGGPSGGRRGSRREAPVASPKAQAASTATTNGKDANATKSPKPTVSALATSSSSPSAPSNTSLQSTEKATAGRPPTGPAASRLASQTNTPSKITASNPTPTTSSSTQAFLKHANPSQGITEPLLLEAFAPFGAISRVEIDKKKGFAYVDFEQPEGLKAAMKSSPIKVAQGSVVVLERKTGSNLTARGGRGGGNTAQASGRGGAQDSAGNGGSPATSRSSSRGASHRGRGSARGGRGNPQAANVPDSTAAGTIASANSLSTVAKSKSPAAAPSTSAAPAPVA